MEGKNEVRPECATRNVKRFKLYQKANEFSTWTDSLYKQGACSVRVREKYIRPLDEMMEDFCEAIENANRLFRLAPPEEGEYVDRYAREKMIRQNRKDAIEQAMAARRILEKVKTRWARILGVDRDSGVPLIPALVYELSRRRVHVMGSLGELSLMTDAWIRWMNGASRRQ